MGALGVRPALDPGYDRMTGFWANELVQLASDILK